ncbi:hypothetical protein WICMUC_001656, partial [Wickerhamomyces mucosus]
KTNSKPTGGKWKERRKAQLSNRGINKPKKENISSANSTAVTKKAPLEKKTEDSTSKDNQVIK